MSRENPSTRETILESALELLVAHGAQVTMREVADRAGVSRQTVYLHFGNRTELLTELVTWMDTERFDLPAYFAPVEEVAEPVDRLVAFVDAALRYQPLIAPVGRALLDAAEHGDPAAAAAFDNRMSARLQGCRDIVTRLADAGQLAPHLTIETATDLLWSVIGLRLWADLTEARGWSQDRARSELARLTRRALTVA